MPKKHQTQQQKYVLEYVASQKEVVSKDVEKRKADLLEIGCSLVRMGKKTVRIIEWHERNKSVVVVIESGGGIDVSDGTVSRYLYPLHKNCFRTFVDFEALEDCGYLDRFANGEEYIIDGKRYGVKDDVVWAGGKRYLSSAERVKFGRFSDFLKNHEGFVVKKSII